MKHITRNKENEVDYITGNLLPKKNLQEAQKIKRMHCWTPQFKREKHGGDLCFWSLLCHYEAFKSDAWLQNTKYKCSVHKKHAPSTGSLYMFPVNSWILKIVIDCPSTLVGAVAEESKVFINFARNSVFLSGVKTCRNASTSELKLAKWPNLH